MLENIKYISLDDFEKIGNILELPTSLIDKETDDMFVGTTYRWIYKDKDLNYDIGECVFKISEHIFSLNPDVDTFLLLLGY